MAETTGKGIEMKTFVLILGLFTYLTATAGEKHHTPIRKDPSVGTYDFKDQVLGNFKLKVRDVQESSIEPYRISLSVACRDGQTLKAEQSLVDNRVSCQFQEYSFDHVRKVLTIRWATSSAKVGEAECDENWSQTFDLRMICRDLHSRH